MKRIKVLAGVGMAAAALATATPGVAQADVASSTFYVDYGASVTTGTIEWGGGRTSYASGSIKARSHYRDVCLQAYSGDDTFYDEKCIRADKDETISFTGFQLHADVRGGVQKVIVQLWADGAWRHSDRCTRDRSYCVDRT